MSNTIPLPEPIGEIVGVRLTPKDTREFWGYFAKGFEGMEKVRVHTADQMHAHAAAVSAAKDARIKVLEDALSKIDAIRNDIIGRQKIGWSSHVYPLVAALGEAGYPGMDYEAARAALGDKTPNAELTGRPALR